MMLLKITLFCCIWCNAVCLRGSKNTLFSTYCHSCCSSMPAFLKRVDFYKLIVLRSEACYDWPAIQCVVIGRIPQAWYGMFSPSPNCDGVSRRDETKTIKTHYKRDICCIQWGQWQKRTYRLWVRSVRLSLQKLELPPLYRNSLCASLQARLLSCQVSRNSPPWIMLHTL